MSRTDHSVLYYANQAPTPLSNAAPSSGGVFSAADYDFLVVADYAENDFSNVYQYGALNYNFNMAGTTRSYADTAEILAHWSNITLTANQKVTLDWTPPTRKKPRWYHIYYQVSGGASIYDITAPGWKLQTTLYSNGNIPGHLTSAIVTGTLAVGTNIQWNVTRFDATLDEVWIDGNKWLHFGAGVLFKVVGSTGNDATYTVSSSRLANSLRGIQTVIKVTGSITTEAALGYVTENTSSALVGHDTFLQTGGRFNGVGDYVTLRPDDKQLVWRQGGVRGISGRLAGRSYVDSARRLESMGITVEPNDLGSLPEDHWLRLVLWYYTGNDVWWTDWHSDTGAAPWTESGYGYRGQYIGRIEDPNTLGDFEFSRADMLAFRFIIEEEV